MRIISRAGKDVAPKDWTVIKRVGKDTAKRVKSRGKKDGAQILINRKKIELEE